MAFALGLPFFFLLFSLCLLRFAVLMGFVFLLIEFAFLLCLSTTRFLGGDQLRLLLLAAQHFIVTVRFDVFLRRNNNQIKMTEMQRREEKNNKDISRRGSYSWEDLPGMDTGVRTDMNGTNLVLIIVGIGSDMLHGRRVIREHLLAQFTVVAINWVQELRTCNT